MKQQQKIISIHLDERSIIRRSDIIEAERRTAINDLLAQNLFALKNHSDTGPYHLGLRLYDRKLWLDIDCQSTKRQDSLSLSVRPFQTLIRDYFLICESYYGALQRGLAQIEAIDMGRRGLHNEAADTLLERLSTDIEMDHDTARRLFTLLCVMHIKGF